MKDNNVLTRAIIIAIGVFVILSFLDGFIAVPMREISTWLSYFMLKATPLIIEKQGTLLSTPHMTFDVIPACSGSTTMRVMIFLGIVWSGMQKTMSSSRKTFLILCVVPIAIIANSLRVSALVIMGHVMYKPVEGFLHEMTGIGAFCLAFTALLVITSLIQQKDINESKKVSKKILLVCFIIVATLAYLPSALWTYNGWLNSPLDKMGFLYFCPLLIGLFTPRQYPTNKVSKRYFYLISSFYFFSFAIAIVAEINILAAVSFLMLIFLGITIQKGTKEALLFLPLLMIAFLGMPTVSFMINKFLIAIGLDINKQTPVLIKIALTICLLIFWYAIKKISFKKKYTTQLENTSQVKILIALLIVLIGAKNFYNNQSQDTTDPGKIELSYLLGDWVGEKTNTEANNNPILQNSWMRRYQKGQNNIQIIITASGGDRHNLHPPEYCLTGSGWQLNESRSSVINEKLVTEMNLQQEDQECYFIYWFTDGESNFANYRSMLKEDTLRRFKGKNTKWFLFRLIANSKESLNNDFLKEFRGKIIVDNNKYEF